MRAAASMALALAGVLVLSPGCFKLDPFLYTPRRTDRYEPSPVGKDEGSTIAAEQIGVPFFIPVTPGIQLGALQVRAAVQPPRAHAIYFHGKGPHLAEESQFEHVKRLVNLGYDVLAFDYRGFGMSTDVAPTEAGLDEDTAAVLAWLSSTLGGRDRIFYYGQSLGAATAIQRAVADPPGALVIESAFASIEEFKTDASLMDFPDEYVAADGWASASRIELISRVLILHGKADDFVRPEFSERLFARAREPKALVLVDGADHGTVAPMMGQAYATTVRGWIDQLIPPP